MCWRAKETEISFRTGEREDGHGFACLSDPSSQSKRLFYCGWNIHRVALHVRDGSWRYLAACAALDRPNVGTTNWLARPCEGRKQVRKEGGKERRCSRFLRVPAQQKLTSLRRRMATGMRSRVRARFTVCVSRLSVQRRLASPLPLWVYCLVSFRPLSSLRRLPYQVSS